MASLELNARVGLMFSKKICIRNIIKGRFWRGGRIYTYIYIHIFRERTKTPICNYICMYICKQTDGQIDR